MLDKETIMQFYGVVLVLTVITTSSCSAIPKRDDSKKRVIDKDLSDLDHELEGEHNNDYDHEAFLGREKAKSFEQLTPEESLDGLSKIVDKIDKDGDGFVTENELQTWIQHVQHQYITTDTNRLWKEHDIKDDTLHWEAYKKKTYGFTDENSDSYKSYKDMIERDLKRWQKADKDHDNILSKTEFTDFLHPEEAEHMQDIVVEETLADIDKDNDGFISLEEYIADIYEDEDDDDEHDEDEEGEPEWVQTERDDFNEFRDKNKDGKLDKEEIKHWIIPEDYDHSVAETKHLFSEADEDRVCDMHPNTEEEEPDWVTNERDIFKKYRDLDGNGRMDPAEVKRWLIPPDYDHALAESKHLIYESDSDKDGKLSRDEILSKHDLFVGSQATDFGEALTRHDEF